MDECKPLVCGKAFEQLQKIEDDLKSNPTRKAARDVVAKVGRCRLSLSNPR